jgi:hypothetical protein
MGQSRDYFRIPFPVTERPHLIVEKDEFEVLDLSERGARVAAAGKLLGGGKRSFDVTVRFKDGTTAKTSAMIHRQEGDQLVLRFRESLPFGVIAGEQRRLLALYGREALNSKPGSAAASAS